MIRVTRLDGSTMVVNDDQIAWIDTHPDTMISMMNGEKLLVRETPDELVERARQFRRTLATQGLFRLAGSREMGA
jgi:flagellar protein FlbD